MGSILGGAIAIMLLSYILEWAIFKRFLDDPITGKATSVFAALIVAVGLASGVGDMPGSVALLSYGIGAIIVLPYKIWRGVQVRKRIAEDEHDTPEQEALRETFE